MLDGNVLLEYSGFPLLGLNWISAIKVSYFNIVLLDEIQQFMFTAHKGLLNP